MSRAIMIILPDDTAARMDAIATELGRNITELAECAVGESALDYFRSRPVDQDPARQRKQVRDALRTAEEFMSGFEDDDLQSGMGQKLTLVRTALTETEARS
jgi:predicted transcriptional regulator